MAEMTMTYQRRVILNEGSCREKEFTYDSQKTASFGKIEKRLNFPAMIEAGVAGKWVSNSVGTRYYIDVIALLVDIKVSSSNTWENGTFTFMKQKYTNYDVVILSEGKLWLEESGEIFIENIPFEVYGLLKSVLDKIVKLYS